MKTLRHLLSKFFQVEGRCVGKDEFGNKYYEHISNNSARPRRWMKPNYGENIAKYDPDYVPGIWIGYYQSLIYGNLASWRSWLASQRDEPPEST